MLDMKKNPIGTSLFLIGLILIFIGSAINCYNTIFKREQPTNTDISESVEEQVVPTDMTAVSKQLNNDLGHFLLYRYDTTADSGKDLLSNSRKRLDLVNSVLQNSTDVTYTEGEMYFPYVSEEKYKVEYIKIYGSEDNYATDLQTYSEKTLVDSTLGVGYIGWNPAWGDVNIERTLTANNIDYDSLSATFTIVGTYSDVQAGTELSNGTFEITYANNGTDNYIISITLTQNVK